MYVSVLRNSSGFMKGLALSVPLARHTTPIPFWMPQRSQQWWRAIEYVCYNVCGRLLNGAWGTHHDRRREPGNVARWDHDGHTSSYPAMLLPFVARRFVFRREPQRKLHFNTVRIRWMLFTTAVSWSSNRKCIQYVWNNDSPPEVENDCFNGSQKALVVPANLWYHGSKSRRTRIHHL